MATRSQQQQRQSQGQRTPSSVNGTTNVNDAFVNAPPPAPAQTGGKKSKTKKSVDPNETTKLLAAKISQLESDATGEQGEEQEIRREVRKATKDLNNLLNGMSTLPERIDALQKRNTDLLADLKRLERDHIKTKKRSDQLQKEKDSQRTELNKVLGVKDKLEKLSREITKDNKKLKEDLRRQEEFEIRIRERMCAKDEALLGDIEEFNENKARLGGLAQNLEVEDLCRQKFKSFVDQFAARELHFQYAMRYKESELHHAYGRLEQQRRLYDHELHRSRSLNGQVQTFSQTETELRSQLNIYVEKFKQVEDTLNNSNELFLTFRKEMEEMSKKTKRLEKDNLNLTRKHDLSSRNIIEMAEDRTKTTKENERLRKQIAMLESTIRQMQSQGRNLPAGTVLDPEVDATESEYDSEEEYEPASDEVYDDDETEDDMSHATAPSNPPTFGPAPPPPPASSNRLPNGHHTEEINGIIRT